MLMRRCPSRSMTIVGDIAQTGDMAGTSSWHEVLDPYAKGRWRLEELTISYRTPSEIMDVAAEVLATIDPTLRVPRAVRSTGVTPTRFAVDPETLPEQVVSTTVKELLRMDEGHIGVIVPSGRIDQLGGAITAAVPDAAIGKDPELR